MKTLNLFGIVNPSPDCINAESVASFLKELKDKEEFTVYINSCGGNVFEGIAIYNLLSEYQNQMTIKIIGEATSIASVISCAGGEGKVLIAETAVMLIHNPWTFGIVDEDYLEILRKHLSTVKKSIIKAYQRKTGIESEELSVLMSEGDYRDAKECVKLKLADSIYVPSETEATDIEESNNLKNEIVKKYLILNLNIDKNNLPINEGDNNMNFNKIEDAVVEIGRLGEKLTTAENQLQVANQKNDQLNSAIQSQQAELQTVNQQLLDAKNQLNDSAQTTAALQEQVFVNEATIFCEKLFPAKLSRAEINGNADIDKGEMPAKVAKLVALRKLSQELYDMECQELTDRTPTASNYLSGPVEGGSDTPKDKSNFLVNHIEEQYNKKRK